MARVQEQTKTEHIYSNPMANLSQALMCWKWCLGTGFSRDFTENRLNLIKPHSKYFARFLVNGKCWKQEQWDCSGSTASHTKGLQTNLTSAQVNSTQHCRVSVPTVLWAEPGEEKQLHGHFHPHSDENSQGNFGCPTRDLMVCTFHLTAHMKGFKSICPFSPIFSSKTGCFSWGQGYLLLTKAPQYL